MNKYPDGMTRPGGNCHDDWTPEEVENLQRTPHDVRLAQRLANRKAPRTELQEAENRLSESMEQLRKDMVDYMNQVRRNMLIAYAKNGGPK